MINIDYIFFIKKTRFKLDLKEIKQNLSEYERVNGIKSIVPITKSG